MANKTRKCRYKRVPLGRANDCKVPCTLGYRATARNRMYLRRHKAGKSIGFTMRSSLKAKGLLKRASGKFEVSPKYCGK